jgi:hypothetical protein
MLCAFARPAQIRKCALPLAAAGQYVDDERMSSHTIHLDRSLRLSVSDEGGRKLATVRLSRGTAEGLADALLGFSGNQARGLSHRSSVTFEAAPLSKPRT